MIVVTRMCVYTSTPSQKSAQGTTLLYLYIGSFAEVVQTCCLPTGNVPFDTDLKKDTLRQESNTMSAEMIMKINKNKI